MHRLVSIKHVHTFLLAVVVSLVMGIFSTAAAQCYQNPTGETAVGVKNASTYFVIFYIDEINKGGVPSGDRSVDFLISPGPHTLRAEARIDGDAVSATRMFIIPAGYACMWTVTDPPKELSSANLRDSLKRKPPIFITLSIPN
jgi:hypothetical protein